MQRFAPREVDIAHREDGSILMQSPLLLDQCKRHICEYLEEWAALSPGRDFLAQRDATGEWRRLTYGDAWRRARSIGQALLDRGLGPEQPLVILSGNSIEHALITFGAMAAGVPVAPLSPSYSLSAGGRKRLSEIVELLQPALVFAQSTGNLADARALPGLADLPWVSVEPTGDTIPLAEFEEVGSFEDVDRAYAKAGPDTVAKILFTSGSTGTPKGVPNTQRMLCACVRAINLLFPFDAPPVTVDWMPWHHTFGGNSTIHMILSGGGTLYIDDGLPLPGRFDATIRNLGEIESTILQNVPAGFQMLIPAMEADDALRNKIFKRIQRFAFGGASLAPGLFQRMQALAVKSTGAEVPFVSGYGTTETGPGISVTHWPSQGRGEVGLPIPGCTVKLVPFGDRFDIRVRGPNVFTGYLRRPDLSHDAFDEEGFHIVGDAVQFLDAADPREGLCFAGRLSENFKLSSGTWVLTGELRLAIIGSAPGIAEAVIAGQDRDDVRLLIWLSPEVAAKPDDAVRRIRAELEAYNVATSGASRRISAFRVLTDRPSMAAGEITDKGYVNQRAVLVNRADLVDGLYTESTGVIICRC